MNVFMNLPRQFGADFVNSPNHKRFRGTRQRTMELKIDRILLMSILRPNRAAYNVNLRRYSQYARYPESPDV